MAASQHAFFVPPAGGKSFDKKEQTSFQQLSSILPALIDETSLLFREGNVSPFELESLLKKEEKKFPHLRKFLDSKYYRNSMEDPQSYLDQLIKQENSITKTKLVDKIVSQLFNDATDDLLLKEALPDDGHDVRDDLEAFAKHLAVQMQEKKITKINNNENKALWDELFKSANPDMQRASQVMNNCLLRKVGDNTCEFIHLDFLTYFAALSMCEFEMERSPRP